jgi:hypothetical protein
MMRLRNRSGGAEARGAAIKAEGISRKRRQDVLSLRMWSQFATTSLHHLPGYDSASAINPFESV